MNRTTYTVEDMLDMLQISRSTLDRNSKTGAIPGRLKAGPSRTSRVRFHKPTVDRWMLDQARGVKATTRKAG